MLDVQSSTHLNLCLLKTSGQIICYFRWKDNGCNSFMVSSKYHRLAVWAHPGLSLASACLLGEFWLAEPHVYHVCGGRAECRQKDTVSCSNRGFRGQTAGWRLKTDIRLVFLSQDGLQQLPHEQHPTRPAAYAGNRLWVQTLFGFSCLFFVVQTVCLKLGGENRFALYTKEQKKKSVIILLSSHIWP